MLDGEIKAHVQSTPSPDGALDIRLLALAELPNGIGVPLEARFRRGRRHAPTSPMLAWSRACSDPTSASTLHEGACRRLFR
jgi:hypothetical protein